MCKRGLQNVSQHAFRVDQEEHGGGAATCIRGPPEEVRDKIINCESTVFNKNNPG
jgi:hypothetical protein